MEYTSQLGLALQNIGQNLPGTFRQRQLDARQQALDEEERRKQALLEQETQRKLAIDEEKHNREKSAIGALGQLSEMNRINQDFQSKGVAEGPIDAVRSARAVTNESPYKTALGKLGGFADTEAGKAGLLAAKTAEDLDIKAANPSAGKNGWAVRLAQGNAIDAMPEGPEKEEAKAKYTRDWATSTWAGYQDPTIEGAARKAAATSGASTTAKIGAETDAAGGGVNTIVAERTNALRKEFNDLPEIKSIKTLQQNAAKANKAYEAYKAGKIQPYEVDQSLGYFASKALDPNSVVMPGEFDRFAKGLGVTGGAQAMVNQLVGGGLKLTDAERESMIGIVNRAIESGKEAAQSVYEYYNDLATKNGADPHSVTGGADYVFKKAGDEWQTVNGVRIRVKK